MLFEHVPAWRHFEISSKGKYLGFFIGPGANDESWKSLAAKYLERARYVYPLVGVGIHPQSGLVPGVGPLLLAVCCAAAACTGLGHENRGGCIIIDCGRPEDLVYAHRGTQSERIDRFSRICTVIERHWSRSAGQNMLGYIAWVGMR